VVTIRAADEHDAHVLARMLAEAADWPRGSPVRSVPELLADPALARYVAEWPRPGDAGVVAVGAEGTEGAAPIGAAWWRYFTEVEQGYGFVDAATPEISIGVEGQWRGQGIATALLGALIDTARSSGVPALSLSVDPDNEARRLYERLGFAVVGVSGTSVTMVRTIS
jgi:ribosomal protein S18 acetylase RimI-like enzyme